MLKLIHNTFVSVMISVMIRALIYEQLCILMKYFNNRLTPVVVNYSMFVGCYEKGQLVFPLPWGTFS